MDDTAACKARRLLTNERWADSFHNAKEQVICFICTPARLQAGNSNKLAARPLIATDGWVGPQARSP